MSEPSDFEIANRAFDLFTLAEREMALEEFARMRCLSISDRFFEAVHRVVRDHKTATAAPSADQETSK